MHKKNVHPDVYKKPLNNTSCNSDSRWLIPVETKAVRKTTYTGLSHSFQTASAEMSNGGLCFCSDKNGHKQLEQKKGTTKVILSWIGAVTEVLAVTQRVPEGRHRATHSPRAARSHFLPDAQPEWPIITPEAPRKEVTIGRFTVLETKW